MAKKENPSSKDFDAQKEAKQKLKAAEKAGSAQAGKANADKAAKTAKKKKVGKFIKDFRGELKKIMWPDTKTVLKNTGIVLLTTTIIGAPIWLLDFVLSEGVLSLKRLAQGANAGISEQAPEFDLGDLNLDDFLVDEEEPAGDAQAADDAEPAAGDAEPAQDATEPEDEPEPATEEPAE